MKLLPILFFLGLFLQAQDFPVNESSKNTSTQLYVGIQGGPQINHLRAGNLPNNSAKMGYSTGLWLELVQNKWGLNSGLYYNTQGATFNIPNHPLEEINIEYIHFPLVFNFYVLPSLSFGIGGYSAFSLKTSYTYKEGSEIVSPAFGHEPKATSLDFGWKLNTQFYLTEKLYMNIYYYHGINKVIDGDFIYNENNSYNSKNSALGLSLGYKFR